MDKDKIQTQSEEFNAVSAVVKAYRNLPPIVDDHYPEARHYYESAINRLIKAMENNNRIPSTPSYNEFDSQFMRVVNAIANELAKARKKFPRWPTQSVYAAAIVCEESGELIRAALQHNDEGGQLETCDKEAIQTAAMCFRFLMRK